MTCLEKVKTKIAPPRGWIHMGLTYLVGCNFERFLTRGLKHQLVNGDEMDVSFLFSCGF